MTDTEPVWTQTSGPFKAFGHRFVIRSTDAGLASYLDELWVACRWYGEPDTSYGLEVAEAKGAATYRLYVEEAVVQEFSNPSIALRDLVRRINADVISAAEDLVVVHAGGAVRDGVGVLFPAAMESGKTTLVAGLMRAGWGYLSDEAVGIDPNGLALQPYPKPLSVDPGSWEVLASSRPELSDNLAPYSTEQWQIPPQQICAGAAAGPVPPALVIGPVYKSGAATTLEPLSLPQAVILLADSCFTLRARPEQSLAALATLARVCNCYRLTVSDLTEGCALINQALDAAMK